MLRSSPIAVRLYAVWARDPAALPLDGAGPNWAGGLGLPVAPGPPGPAPNEDLVVTSPRRPTSQAKHVEGILAAHPVGAAETGVPVVLLGEGGDPLIVNVMVRWPQGGYCSGQFRVAATETPTQVHVGSVESRVNRGNGGCAELGTVDGTAWVPLQLSSPLGERRVIRASDGAVLQVSAPRPVTPAVAAPSSRAHPLAIGWPE